MSDDVVNHPSHYNQYEGFEVIDVCEQLRAPDGKGNYNRGNALKYLARAGWKNPDKHVEDLQKAIFYIQREIDRLKTNNWMDTKNEDVLPAVKAVEAVAALTDAVARFCPECGIRLTAGDACPNGHGYMERPDDAFYKYWVSVDNAEVCKICDSTMQQMLDDPGKMYCPQGHGHSKPPLKVV